MITPSFGLTATERVLPKLALDFTTASLDSRITFTRTTGASNPATYVNSSGVVTAATNNQARFDYDPITLVCKGLLIEESRANLALNSQDVSATSRTGLTFATNVVNSPDSTQNADSINETTATSGHQFSQGVSISATTYTYSVFVKWQTGTTRNVGVFPVASSGLGTNRGVIFNSSGAFVAFSGDTGSDPTYTSTSFSNGWYRFSVTVTATSAGTAAPLVRMISGTSASYAGSTDQGLYVWGWQLEAGAFATSYIPTTTTALTRNADVATMTGTNFSDWFNASEGTVEVSWSAPQQANQTSFSINLSNANRFENYRNSAGNIRMFAYSGGVLQVASGPVVDTSTGPFDCVLSYKASNYGIATNASSVVTNAATLVPVGCDKMAIGNSSSGANFINGTISRLNYWPQRLTNSELQAFSK